MGSQRLVLALGFGALTAGAAAFVACDTRPAAPIDDDAGNEAGADAQDVPPPPPKSEPGKHDVAVVDTRRIVPSPGLPPEAPVFNSNNNLDVVRFDGRVYLAWRTAPDHFASDKTVMVLASSADEITWKLERTFAVGTDVREPNFVAVGGSLFFYLSRLGKDPVKFEPQGVFYSKRAADGTWSELAPVLRVAASAGDAGVGDAGAPAPMTGYMTWRTKEDRGTPFMSSYLGGEHIYQFDGKPLDVELLTTTDGITWQGTVVSRGGGSEMDFARGDDGTLYAVIRNEAGDATGAGSKVCRASKDDLFTWTCKSDPKKYDSPLMFWHDGEAYLVARRNVTATGNYDLGTDSSREANFQSSILGFQLEYRKATKRCSLWRYVRGASSPGPSDDRIAYILDLPSRGDTCFPARIDTSNPNELAIYNYSSDVDGKDVSWGEGQVGPTFVYRHLLRFTKR